MGNAFVTATPSPDVAAEPGSKGPVVLVAVAAGVLLLVAAGVSVRMLGDRTPPFAAAQSLSTTVSVVGTSPTSTATAGDAGTDVRVEASIAGGQRTSNAVVVDSSTMVTTMAAVAGATKLSALLPDGRRLTAKLLGKDARSGVAVVSITGGRLHTANTGSAVPLRSGERLWMAGEGNPGTITALGRNTTSPDGSKLRHVIRLDVDERKAREGMALVDGSGEVVALCTWDAKGDVVGIPIDLATSAARSLRHNGGRLVLPWIGVTGRDVDPDREAGVPWGAALLTAVDEGGPAASAGLVPGDLVLALAETRISSISALVLAARSFDTGDTVAISLLRGGEPLELSLTLGRLP
jgi:S1-C subfamily serine protease